MIYYDVSEAGISPVISFTTSAGTSLFAKVTIGFPPDVSEIGRKSDDVRGSPEKSLVNSDRDDGGGQTDINLNYDPALPRTFTHRLQ